MVKRENWLKRIQEIWQKVPIVWLSGVRRVGKTTLAKEIENALYLNCDLESVRERLRSIEFFYKGVDKPVIIFDEIHRLEDPSIVLKIGADEFSHFKILATGSSTLAATQKFSDSLTGRKREIHLVPVLYEELEDFGVKDIRTRLLKGGLPPVLLSEALDEGFYQEWIESYFARDVQELFKVEKRHSFLKLLELLLRQNGAMLESTKLAKMTGLSVPTVYNYLEVLETTHVIQVLRPFHGGGKKELIKQPKCYAFDTGFVSFFNGWSEIGPKECGLLWENLVLETLQSIRGLPRVNFWRDQDQHEIDFVCPQHSGEVHAIECKWNENKFDVKSLNFFRNLHPKGNNIVVSPKIVEAYESKINGHKIIFCPLNCLWKYLI